VRGKQRKELVRDVLENRGKYALFITVLTTMVVLATASVLVLQFEAEHADASITSGRDAFWYSIVTITTVGYGDVYPVTAGGRIAATFIMIAGVGLIGALASLLAAVLVGGDSPPEEPEAASTPATASDVDALRVELAELRALLERIETRLPAPP
jgi:voltage-gated potassium channel